MTSSAYSTVKIQRNNDNEKNLPIKKFLGEGARGEDFLQKVLSPFLYITLSLCLICVFTFLFENKDERALQTGKQIIESKNQTKE